MNNASFIRGTIVDDQLYRQEKSVLNHGEQLSIQD